MFWERSLASRSRHPRRTRNARVDLSQGHLKCLRISP